MLICINPKEYKLTKYKKYEKIGDAENRILVRNDAGKKASYSPGFFKEFNVNTLTDSDFKKIAIGKTQVVNVLTGKKSTATGTMNGSIIPGINNAELWPLNSIVFAHKLKLCSNDEYIPPPPRVLIKDIKSHIKKGIKYNDHPYIVKALNGKDNVVLLSRINSKEVRVSKIKLLNNENCYEG